MRALEEMPADLRRRIKFVLSDIDDTMTHDGRLPAASHAAMEALQASGRVVIPVTGRPAGWCDLIARQWAVDAVVGENGALYYRYDPAARHMHRVYAREDAQRVEDQRRLASIAADVRNRVPASAIAADQPFRVTDLAVDFAEDVGPLPDRDIKMIAEIFATHGATAKVSSIHVNGWFGQHDKLSMTRRLLWEIFSMDIERDNGACLFIGDSPNDGPMFSYFDNSVGVANVQDFMAHMTAFPKWVTAGRAADGFAEAARIILADGG
jgi:hypothetical protein